MASNTDSIVSQSHPVPSNEIVAPSHGSHQQHVRQGNDYQNVTVAEGGRAILGNVYADNFSMSILDPSQRPQKTEEEKRQDFMRSLGFDVMDSRLATIGIAHRNTCTWLYSRVEYLTWQDPGSRAEHHGFLWIKGKPGAGKSTLMKCALHHAQSLNQRNTAIFSFFFNARGRDLEKTTEGMYRSLLHQVYTAFPDRLPGVLPNHSTDPSKHTWQLPILQTMLRDALLNFGNTAEFICYIDALDECEEDAIRLAIEYFEELGELAVSQNTKISICFASRHYPNITMRRYQGLNLDEQEDHHEDIRKFVEGKLRGTGATHFELSKEISHRSSGVFLWANLVVQILNRSVDHGATRMQLMANLKAVPTGIEALLKSILMDASVFLLPTLLWVLFAFGPPTASQLYIATMVGAERLTAEDLDQTETTQEQMRLFILSASKGLVELSKDPTPHAQFIHESVREYLLNGGLSILDENLAENLSAKSHYKLATWCRVYIQLDPDFGPDEDESGFLVYALDYLYHHCEDAFEGGVLQLEFLDSIHLSALRRLAGWFMGHDCPRLLLGYHCQHLLLAPLVQIECRSLVEGLLRRQLKRSSSATCNEASACATLHNDAIDTAIPYLNVDSMCYMDVFLTTVRRRLGTSVQLMLDCGADPNLVFTDSTPLLAALSRNDRDMVKLLLHHGADPDLETPDDTPLLAALSQNCCDMVELLLHHGANPNLALMLDETTQIFPLARASFVRQCTRCVKMLLESGADPDFEGSKGALLLTALETGDCDMTELLLHHKANPSVARVRRGEVQTPLTIAITRRSSRLVKLLLERGADVNYDGGPLAMSILTNQQNVTRLLLDHGADPNGAIHDRPLCLAVMLSDRFTVRMLLDAGADPRLKDGMDQSPLHVFCLGNKHLSEIGRCEMGPIAKSLLDAGAEVDTTDLEGRSALIIAVENADSSSVQLLLRHGANVNANHAADETALIVAARVGVLGIVQLLLDAGADVNAIDTTRRTALIMAVEVGNFNIARLLVDRGANLDMYGHEGVVRYLRLRMAEEDAMLD
jgi:ankyrin repeat protein